MKATKKTTSVLLKAEFWMTLVTSVSGLLLAFGVITPTQSSAIAAIMPKVIGALMSLLSTMDFVRAQHAEKVEVFRAMCAMSMQKEGEASVQSVGDAGDKVAEIARAAGL